MRRYALLALGILCMACGEDATSGADAVAPPVDVGASDTTTAPDTAPPPQDIAISEDTALPPGCCSSDAECDASAFCLGGGESPGVCAALLGEGDCFDNADCNEGGTCEGASVCPCAEVCVQGTEAGTCDYGDPPADECCAADKDCAEDQVCTAPTAGDVEGLCTEGFTDEQSCFRDEHCAADQLCDGAVMCPCEVECFAAVTPGTCTPKEGPGKGTEGACCNSVTDQFPDCEANLICLEHPDGGNGICIPAPAEGACYGDADCKEGTCVGGIICGCDMNCVSVLGACEADPGPNCCTADMDCNPNELCVETPTGGVCKPLPPASQCWDDSQCGGEIGSCANVVLCPCQAVCAKPDAPGTCANPPGPPGCCTSADECGNTEICVETLSGGICKSPPPAGSCWTDLDCEVGGTCDGAVLCPCGAVCFAPDELGMCKGGGPGPGPDPGTCCSVDSDCPGGSCAVADGEANGVCEKKLAFGECYNDSTCDGGACVGGSLCPCDVTCVTGNVPGKCGPPIPTLPGCCDSNADCSGNQICASDGKSTPGPPTPFGEQGVCVDPPPTGQCWTDSGCTGNMVCVGATLCLCGEFCDPAQNKTGTCQEKGPGGPSAGCCSDDTDCPMGDQCVTPFNDMIPGGFPTPGMDGVCKPMAAAGTCWSNADCGGAPGSCGGASVCPCGAFCFLPDQMGTCGGGGPGSGAKECCSSDKDCPGGSCAVANGMVNGVCQPALSGMECYNVDHCGGGTCINPVLCPCETTCTKPITPGFCGPPGLP